MDTIPEMTQLITQIRKIKQLNPAIFLNLCSFLSILFGVSDKQKDFKLRYMS